MSHQCATQRPHEETQQRGHSPQNPGLRDNRLSTCIGHYLNPQTLYLPDESATLAFGAALARALAPGLWIALRGDLGAGKTTLVRGLLTALGHCGPVKSPSYTLVEPYLLSSLNFYHFDLYRFRDESEWHDNGFSEYFGLDSVCAIEWPEKAAGLLPIADLDIRIIRQEIALDSPGSGSESGIESRRDSGSGSVSGSRSDSGSDFGSLSDSDSRSGSGSASDPEPAHEVLEPGRTISIDANTSTGQACLERLQREIGHTA